VFPLLSLEDFRSEMGIPVCFGKPERVSTSLVDKPSHMGLNHTKPDIGNIMMKCRVVALVVTLLVSGPEGFAAEPSLPAVRMDIEYAQVDDVSLTLDAFVPDGPGPFPTCILVHGGGFTKGDKQSYIKPLFEPLSQSGFVWFTINYRLAPQHRWPACVEDVETAIRWVKEHASEYKVDINRMALIGESAGGFLVSYVAARPTDETRVAAVIPFYGAHDREFQIRHFQVLGESTKALLGLTELNEAAWQRLRETSSTTYLHQGMPPFLLIHGDQDQQVPLEQSVRFQEKMKALGNACDLIIIPGGSHGMGGWNKLNSDYREQMIGWLNKVFNERADQNRH